MPKRIVVFCDGTWKTADDDRITNVVKLMRSVKATAADGKPQVTFYDPGVGTESKIRRFFGGAFGVGLSTNVRDGYRFIANNYEDGDEIFLFGFSRGAFTARSIGGLIGKFGLLRKEEMDQFGEAYDVYRNKDAGEADLAPFVALGHGKIKIHFIGVWDTVGSLGVPVSRINRLLKKFRDFQDFHDTSLNTNIRHAYHAVAIDERRGPFPATLWIKGNESRVETAQQVWFCGVHSNVGGGYPDAGLENCALHWMTAKAGSHGLDLNTGYLAGFEPNPGGELYDSRKGMYLTMNPKIRDVDWTEYAGAAIHESVLQRLQKVDKYRPDNLLSGLKVHPVVDTDGNIVRPPGPYTD
jgi:uncharacterized protein (DUF2235 family)